MGPLLSQQWGPKFDADEIVGLEKAVESQLGKTLAGVGFFTLDGVLSQKPGKARRYWHGELQKLNETYKIPCVGDNCGNVADQFCDDGSTWKKTICNADAVCNGLQ